MGYVHLTAFRPLRGFEAYQSGYEVQEVCGGQIVELWQYLVPNALAGAAMDKGATHELTLPEVIRLEEGNREDIRGKDAIVHVGRNTDRPVRGAAVADQSGETPGNLAISPGAPDGGV